MAIMTAAEIRDFFAAEFPQALATGTVIEEVGDRWARLRHPARERDLRPGGTVSGPTLMALTDQAVYVAILAQIGRVALAVTTSLHIDFLRRPAPGDIIARADLLKLGKRLAVGAVTLCSDGDPAPVAHATATYSLPPRAA